MLTVPAIGLDVSDSFLRYARDSNGQPMPGKLYVEVCGRVYVIKQRSTYDGHMLRT